jgi:hypothetical protein
VHSVTISLARPRRPPSSGRGAEQLVDKVLLVAMAEGPHPIPSRTRSLRLPAPMVLQGRLCGRVGRRQRYAPFERRGLFYLVSRAEAGGNLPLGRRVGYAPAHAPIAQELALGARSRRLRLSEIEIGVKMPRTRGKTERPREPLLQLGTGFRTCLCRIGGRL